MDLIDREALLKDMGLTDAVKYGNKDSEQQTRSYSTWMSYEIADAILDASAVNLWIPCSERLPEESGTYLVWFEYYKYGDYDGLYATHGIGSFYRGRWAFINHETGWQSLRVIAWMPLPEPPKEVDENG